MNVNLAGTSTDACQYAIKLLLNLQVRQFRDFMRVSSAPFLKILVADYLLQLLVLLGVIFLKRLIVNLLSERSPA